MADFDWITHKRDSKGMIKSKNPYRMHVDKNGRKLCRDGVWQYENGALVPESDLEKSGLLEKKKAVPEVKAAPEPAPIPAVKAWKKVEPKAEEVKDEYQGIK